MEKRLFEGKKVRCVTLVCAKHSQRRVFRSGRIGL